MKRFATGLVLRVVCLTLTGGGLGYALVSLSGGRWLWGSAGVVALAWQTVALYAYVTGVNRKLTRFLESVQYADFSVAFRADNGLGPSFDALNQQFNLVLDAFRQARAEKETNLHYLNTIVQHLSVGLLAFDSTGKVELVNQAALRLLGIYRLRNLPDLETAHPVLLRLLRVAAQGTPTLYQTTDGKSELSVRGTVVRLRGRLITLVSLQNIHSELQQKELEAWQNLTSVLRHEIMNAITPIVSLVGTMQQIIDTELSTNTSTPAGLESVDDLRLALSTIEKRGHGIMRFVDAYRHFTTIPAPRLAETSVAGLLAPVLTLAQAEAGRHQIPVVLSPVEPRLSIRADAGQVEMILLNLIRNAIESLTERPFTDPTIQLSARLENGKTIIRVSDNGPGIDPDAMDKIFIPFFTTKKNGSGIGLSLSRQIMQLHGGQLTVTSTLKQGSTFTLVFG